MNESSPAFTKTCRGNTNEFTLTSHEFRAHSYVKERESATRVVKVSKERIQFGFQTCLLDKFGRLRRIGKKWVDLIYGSSDRLLSCLIFIPAENEKKTSFRRDIPFLYLISRNMKWKLHLIDELLKRKEDRKASWASPSSSWSTSNWLCPSV